ncbi:unnamed protein product [Bursaphelenchus okinawaensis]|uniref:Glycoprotein-N-acetylgalactosamine 3-beta-galactosyltransferase 1 n=1 Tax=Bursaphelenchus okinawaensis TaxID=465554 RepID=A0A811L9J9_9BILA|nr:unnamed protein product [Bursaphelenchus okinawaensis]CAG9119793.1 unnamed protein product [Bursaphelenchus okinawaensis]
MFHTIAQKRGLRVSGVMSKALFRVAGDLKSRFAKHCRCVRMTRNPVILYVFGVICGAFLYSYYPLIKDSTVDDVIIGSSSRESGEEHNVMMYNHDHEETAVIKELNSQVRILCWIMTHNTKNNNIRATAVNRTWAPKCTKYLFVTTNMTTLPSIDLNITEGRGHLWQKTKRAFKYVYDHYGQEYDWFVKADDDTFFYIENLKFMLLGYDYRDALFFGCRFKVIVKDGYMSGGAGYVLSREAVRRFVEQALPDPIKCKSADVGNEDVEIGKCLHNVGVTFGDSRDNKGKHRMLPMPPNIHFDFRLHSNRSAVPNWFFKYIYHPYDQKGECCSDYMISFHYVGTSQMYTLFNLAYHVRVFGISDENLLLQGEDLRDRIRSLAVQAKPLGT